MRLGQRIEDHGIQPALLRSGRRKLTQRSRNRLCEGRRLERLAGLGLGVGKRLHDRVDRRMRAPVDLVRPHRKYLLVDRSDSLQVSAPRKLLAGEVDCDQLFRDEPIDGNANGDRERRA